ncbi:MAG: hypothetical protein WC455_30610 [Dehalococcoidia bacterium]|jgi:hypothetical protein
MKREILSLCIATFIMVSLACAFPLSGQSGDISKSGYGTNVTVFGIIPIDLNDDTTRIAVDLGTATGYKGTVSLVDDQDKFYRPSEGGSSIDGGWSKDRFFLAFDVPKGTVIKRLKFEPMLPGETPGEMFSIDWESVPETSDDGLKMKMYSVTSQNEEAWDLDYTNSNSWVFDIKLTNDRSENIALSSDNLAIVDQYGWEYEGRDHVGFMQNLGQLAPGESMRFDVTFSKISKLSRPVMLKYQNLTLDISAWT